MSSNSIGKNFTFTTWGESHGKAIGCVIDGVPSKINLEGKMIFSLFLNKRKPGQSKYTTQRKEDDKVEILSGVFEGYDNWPSNFINNHIIVIKDLKIIQI